MQSTPKMCTSTIQVCFLAGLLTVGFYMIIMRRGSRLRTNLKAIKGKSVLIVGPFSKQTIALSRYFSTIGYDIFTVGSCEELKQLGAHQVGVDENKTQSLQIILGEIKPAIVINGQLPMQEAAELDEIALERVNVQFDHARHFVAVIQAVQKQFRAQKSGIFIQVVERDGNATPLKVFDGAFTAFQLRILQAAAGEGVAFGASYHAFYLPKVRGKDEEEEGLIYL